MADILNELTIVISLMLVAVILLYLLSRKKVAELRTQLIELANRKQSLSTKYGRMSEQFFPFLEQYPYDENNFRFIGNPIDGVQFEKDKIIFIEFKAANSQLSVRQRDIRDMINKGRIEFREFRIK